MADEGKKDEKVFAKDIEPELGMWFRKSGFGSYKYYTEARTEGGTRWVVLYDETERPDPTRDDWKVVSKSDFEDDFYFDTGRNGSRFTLEDSQKKKGGGGGWW